MDAECEDYYYNIIIAFFAVQIKNFIDNLFTFSSWPFMVTISWPSFDPEEDQMAKYGQRKSTLTISFIMQIIILIGS